MSKNIVLKLKKLDEGLPTPAYANPGDAGLDLYAAEDHVLAPGERTLIGTGIAIAIPGGYAGFVQPRSGLAAKQGFSIVNTPGLIDSGSIRTHGTRFISNVVTEWPSSSFKRFPSSNSLKSKSSTRPSALPVALVPPANS